MQVSKQKLISALEKVKPGLASKEMIEQSTSFAFMNGRVVTYNDEISISCPVEELDITGAVQAKELYDLLSKINQDEIELSIEESEIKIQSKNTKAGLALSEQILMPLDEVGEIGDWRPIPNRLLEALRFASFSCSRDMSKPVLTCVNITPDGRIESSDNWRITRYQLGEEVPTSTPLLIPATSVRELIKYDVKEMSVGSGWVHFRTENDVVFSCRVFEDNFANIAPILDNIEGQKINLPKTTSDILERAEVFAKRDNLLDEEVALHFGSNKMKVECQSNAGWFQEEANVRYKSDPVTVRINPIFLQQIVDRTRECVLSKQVAKFEECDGEVIWEHVVSLSAEE